MSKSLEDRIYKIVHNKNNYSTDHILRVLFCQDQTNLAACLDAINYLLKFADELDSCQGFLKNVTYKELLSAGTMLHNRAYDLKQKGLIA